MQIIHGADFSFFDVDDTLVMWDTHLVNSRPDECMAFHNPDDPTITWMLLPNQTTIRALKAAKMAGSTVIVWSAGGWDWALEVVRALGLSPYVDAVMSKPNRVYDDLPVSEICGTRYDFSKQA